jgi:hypothetical protein
MKNSLHKVRFEAFTTVNMKFVSSGCSAVYTHTSLHGATTQKTAIFSLRKYLERNAVECGIECSHFFTLRLRWEVRDLAEC